MPPKMHLSVNAFTSGPLSQSVCGWLGSRVTISLAEVTCHLCLNRPAKPNPTTPTAPTAATPLLRYGRGCREMYDLPEEIPDTPWPTWRAALRHYIAITDDGWASRSPADPDRFEAIPDGVFRNDGDKAQRQALKLASVSKALDLAFTPGDFEGLSPEDCRSVLLFMVCGRPIKVRTRVGRDGPQRKQIITVRVPITKLELAEVLGRSPHIVTAIVSVGASRINESLHRKGITAKADTIKALKWDVIGIEDIARRLDVSVSTLRRMITYADHGLPIEYVDGKWRSSAQEIDRYLSGRLTLKTNGPKG